MNSAIEKSRKKPSLDEVNAAVEAELELAKTSSIGKTKGPWTREQDEALLRLVSKLGPRNWHLISGGIPGRSAKSCRLRWCNQLDPSLQHKPFTGNITQPTLLPIIFLMLDSCFGVL